MTEPTKQSPDTSSPTVSGAKPGVTAPVKPSGQPAAAPPQGKAGAPPSVTITPPAKPSAAAPAASVPAKTPAPAVPPTTASGATAPPPSAAKAGGPPPPPPPRGEPPRSEPPPRAGRSALAVLCAVGFLLLFGGLYYLYAQDQQFAADLSNARQRLAQVEARPSSPPASPVDLKPLESRIAALEQRVKAIGQTSAATTAPAPPTTAAPSTTASAAPPPPPAADVADIVAPLAARLAAVEKRVADAEQKTAQADQRVEQAEQKVGQIAAQTATVNDQAARATRIGQAAVALNAGLPLGDIPAAPPALAKFAKTRPPTESELRLAFPAAAARAAEASRPPTIGESLLQRMWLHVRSLVTIRDGDKVVVGAPAATVLAQAQGRLDAGDIAGAVTTLGALDGPAAQAIAGWREQAQALLDARAALAKMANG
jgi:hypothetical protein